MPYLRLRSDPISSDVSCSSDCGCASCSGKGSVTFLGQSSTATHTVAPIFHFDCPVGCAPFPAAECRTVLRRAIRDAIFLASNAASKLEASPREASTVRRFRFFFGHDPSRPVPWAGNMESGASVAHRFRKVAEALQNRGTRFRCVPCGTSIVPECPLDAPAFPCPINARAVPPNAIELCPRFWGQVRWWRAGIVLHEMFHLLYHEFLRHDPQERRRDNAHCYEAFALRVAGRVPDRCDICRCQRRPT